MFKKKDDIKNNDECKNKDLKDKVEENSSADDKDPEEEKQEDTCTKDVDEESAGESEQKEKEDELKNIKSENEELKIKIGKSKSQCEALKDRLARTVAEYDNFRKRTAKEKEKIYTDVCEDVLKEILPVLDNLERAIKVDGSADDLKKGVEMTVKIFNEALKKLDVDEIPADGEFDPNFHNAVMHVEDENYDKNSIAEVFQKGYKRGDKVIRYSMVKVAN
jgi:molecular chaperone GrpE